MRRRGASVYLRRSIRVKVAPTLFAYSSPTAKQLVGLVHDTSDSPLPYVASGGLGLGTIAQPVPFQCSTKPKGTGGSPKSSPAVPTAKQLVELAHDTLFSANYQTPDGWIGMGLATTAQTVPLQRPTNAAHHRQAAGTRTVYRAAKQSAAVRR